jgi:hypothetical protein
VIVIFVPVLFVHRLYLLYLPMFLILSYWLTTDTILQVITKWMYYYLLLSSKKLNNNIWKMTVSLLTANNITSTVYEWLGYFISPYWWHTQLKHFWTKNHTATILNYLTLTRKIQREWTLVLCNKFISHLTCKNVFKDIFCRWREQIK